MLDQVRHYRLYILMFALNLAVLVGVIYLLRRPEPRIIAISTPAPRVTSTPILIEIQVSGAVNAPGVYKLSFGSHLSDALERAGGARPDADLNALNLARRLNDGDKIEVPLRAAAPETATLAPPLVKTASPKLTTTLIAKVNINTATLEQLAALPHIGQALAQRIIDYRTLNGAFKKIEDIKNVRGIGDALFNEIKDLITVSGI